MVIMLVSQHNLEHLPSMMKTLVEEPTTIMLGISTVLSAAVGSSSVDQISIENVEQHGFEIGDYLRIDNEIMRIKTTVGSNPVKVFRGVVGTKSAPTLMDRRFKKSLYYQLNLGEHQSPEHLVTHLNILDMVLVTTQQHYHKDRQDNLL